MSRLLITGGCSFSDVGIRGSELPITQEQQHDDVWRDEKTYQESWPWWLQLYLECPGYPTGHGAEGNGMIARRVMWQIEKALKTYKAEDLRVGVMWSGKDRLEMMATGGRKPPGMELFYNAGFINEPNDSPWRILNPGWVDIAPYVTRYYEFFHNDIHAQVLTLEHMLRLQEYLKARNIKYFFTTFAEATLDPDCIAHQECEWLYKQLDKTNFLPIKHCGHWTRHISKYNHVGDDDHPTEDQHRDLTNKIIIPWIKQRGW